MLDWFPWNDGARLDEPGGCIGNPWGGCCPDVFCGTGGPVERLMCTGDPDFGTGGAEGPEGTVLTPCVSSDPPLN